MKNPPISAERLRYLVHYCPNTGQFTRRVSTAPRAMAGMKCGDTDGKGYLRLRVDGHRCLAHRLAWLYMNGHWPDQEIDHRNMIRTDNRWVNLRVAGSSMNKCNRRAYKNNKSGFKGVSWHKSSRKWRARIFLNGKDVNLGLFTSPEDANKAYGEAAKKNFGEFARLS